MVSTETSEPQVKAYINHFYNYNKQLTVNRVVTSFYEMLVNKHKGASLARLTKQTIHGLKAESSQIPERHVSSHSDQNSPNQLRNKPQYFG